ncbi:MULTISPECIES: small acid-soluble spore protein P [Paenibacillus]|uniref:Small acid-soluble spore protein P n=1 Tax=Paenibacillus residui TaxID=629724 RepID=A0ABW3DD62_9BACL
MPKTKTIPVPSPDDKQFRDRHDEPANEPLSGSKKVKNHNHSRNNHGEGS